jgi:hypothetical protein
MRSISPARPPHTRSGHDHRNSHANTRPRQRHRRLASYRSTHGRREIIARPAAGCSTLVIDRGVDAGDERLLAHLHPDEPPANASIVCRLYLADARRPRCRTVMRTDLETAPATSSERQPASLPDASAAPTQLLDRTGRSYRLTPTTGCRSFPELRWHRTFQVHIHSRPRYEP